MSKEDKYDGCGTILAIFVACTLALWFILVSYDVGYQNGVRQTHLRIVDEPEFVQHIKSKIETERELDRLEKELAQ